MNKAKLERTKSYSSINIVIFIKSLISFLKM